MRALAPEVPGSTARPGVKSSAVLAVVPIGTRTGAAQVVSLVDLAMTMSLPPQPDRNRQSAHVT